MLRYLIVSIFGGLLFGVMDAVINNNSLALKLFQVYQPIAKTSVNSLAGISIDIFFGLVMAGLFIQLHKKLPGQSGFVKGLSFGLMAWFFRVVMQTASSWMMFNIPGDTLIYGLLTGLVEMAVIGIFLGLTLKPKAIAVYKGRSQVF
ncbi:MAG: hypothetical protein HPY50_15215 [Firmicutes bacterium]|nr:hypothetical protein [Bacillota bacterium]